jgi:ferredoxin
MISCKISEMIIDKIKRIYFSPTHTTKSILDGITNGLGTDNVEDIDLTLPGNPGAVTEMKNNGKTIAIIGMPVYAGRIPPAAVKRLEKIKGNNTPAIAVVLYGNREYEDALLELTDLAANCGFKPIAAAAFIGEHSFSTPSVPLSPNRPNESDMNHAAAFGSRIREKLQQVLSVDQIILPPIPGNRPYVQKPPAPKAIPVTAPGTCTLCGKCEIVCPTGAISVNPTIRTNPDHCIMCCACVKYCPTNARQMQDEWVGNIRNWLATHYHLPKEPEFFIQ